MHFTILFTLLLTTLTTAHPAPEEAVTVPIASVYAIETRNSELEASSVQIAEAQAIEARNELEARNKIWTCPANALDYLGGDCSFSWSGKCYAKCIEQGRKQNPKCKAGSEGSLILTGWCTFPGHKMCVCCCYQ
jgi:hypothetical protein